MGWGGIVGWGGGVHPSFRFRFPPLQPDNLQALARQGEMALSMEAGSAAWAGPLAGPRLALV